MVCGKKILVKSFNVPETVALAFNGWNKKYKALHDDWVSDKIIHRDSGQALKDDLSEINLEGITLSQDLTKERETYFLLFNDNALGEVTVPDLCPYCGIKLVLSGRQRVMCCPDCRIAFELEA